MEWVRARRGLLDPVGFNAFEITVDGQEVGEARNAAIREARRQNLRYLFFLDSDVIPQPKTLADLVTVAENNPEFDVFSGVYCSKKEPKGCPWIWRRWLDGITWDWTLGDQITDAIGIPMGCCLLRLSLFDRLPEPWFKTVQEFQAAENCIIRYDETEDIHFCRLCEKAGIRIWVDTRQLCYHFNYETGQQVGLLQDSLPVRRYLARMAGSAVPAKPTRTVLHAGCGTVPLPDELFPRDQWQEIRLDADPAANPNVVASITSMPQIGNRSVDAVYASHVLEHVTAHEVPQALAEFHRVLRPGGVATVLTPDLQEAAEWIANGDEDRVLYQSDLGPIYPRDVLYGHGGMIADGNHHQQHRTGFTQQTLQRCLLAAGFDAVAVAKTERCGLFAQAQAPEEQPTDARE